MDALDVVLGAAGNRLLCPLCVPGIYDRSQDVARVQETLGFSTPAGRSCNGLLQFNEVFTLSFSNPCSLDFWQRHIKEDKPFWGEPSTRTLVAIRSVGAQRNAAAASRILAIAPRATSVSDRLQAHRISHTTGQRSTGGLKGPGAL